MIRVRVLGEHGRPYALLGLSLSYDKSTSDEAAMRCVRRGGSHAKFLESIALWLDITAPRYFWQQFDTYRAGVTKQSGSTMHTLTKRELTQDDFSYPIPGTVLDELNLCIQQKDLDGAKNLLPEGFLQRRVVCLNYKVLAHIYHQRKDHKLVEWWIFLKSVLEQIEYPDYIYEYGQKGD